MSATFPSALVLIVCKVISGGPDDINSGMTGSRNLDWDLSGGVYHCRRIEVQVMSAAEAQGQQPPPWTPDACMRAAMTIGPQWDMQHQNENYRFRFAACPTPIHTSPDPYSPIIGWVMPDCGHRETMVCETDSTI